MAEDIPQNVLSDEDEESLIPITLHGTLHKWTNYIHGWQQRYFVLTNNTLSYYKSENDSSFGCRGAVSIQKAVYKPHDIDECRFDIGVANGGDMWYLRAENSDMRNQWLEAIESQRISDSAYGSDNSLKRHGSTISIGSTLSQTSITSRRSLLKEKLSEMDAYKDVLSKQIDTIQSFYESLSLQPGMLPPVSEVDFRGESMTFKATSQALLLACTQCVDLVVQNEDIWRKKLDREVECRRKAETAIPSATRAIGIPVDGGAERSSLMNGPDMVEGPHSLLNEDDFFDAVEAFIEQNDQEVEQKRQIRNKVRELQLPSRSGSADATHPLLDEIRDTTKTQFHYALMGLGGEGGWQLFAEDGLMKMYKRELEVDGLVCDPLKAVHVVKGVTAREMCHYFFSPDVRYEWETTLESMNVVEVIDRDETLIFHQIHKRVWPAAQRDALFWSHMEQMKTDANEIDSLGPPVSGTPFNTWMVCNKSCDSPEIPVGRCLRMSLTVCLVGQTYISGDPSSAARDDLTTRITYCSSINPGGWAPASVLRSIYKREYPKFLKRFTLYVKEQTENKPINL